MRPPTRRQRDGAIPPAALRGLTVCRRGIRKTVGIPGSGVFFTSYRGYHTGVHSAAGQGGAGGWRLALIKLLRTRHGILKSTSAVGLPGRGDMMEKLPFARGLNFKVDHSINF